MKQIIRSIKTQEDLSCIVRDKDILIHDAYAKSTLIQVYSSVNDMGWLNMISLKLGNHFKRAAIVGATTSGEIINGITMTGETLVAFTFFISSQAELIALPFKSGTEREKGIEAGQRLSYHEGKIKGLLLLATATNLNMTEFIKGLVDYIGDYPVFGGTAGYYQIPRQTLVLAGSQVFDRGIAAVVLTGPDLEISVLPSLGWKAFGREMHITETDGMEVKTIDNEPAFTVYRRYVNVENDEFFAVHAVGYSFLLQRKNQTVARVPIGVTNDNGIQFAADVFKDEVFRIGYADPAAILEQSRELHNTMKQFNPDAIFIYSCGTRLFFLKDHIQMETQPFEEIASTLGFYSAGEFMGGKKEMNSLNSTILAVGIRENDKHCGLNCTGNKIIKEKNGESIEDIYKYDDSNAISRLVHFVEAVTSDMDKEKQELIAIASVDKLTQIYNRFKLDEILENLISKSLDSGTPCSVILLDIDHFKEINDTYGHPVGDEVLKEFALRLKNCVTNEEEAAGRWGGEEFLFIAFQSSQKEVEDLAEKIRKSISEENFGENIKLTCSIGVASYKSGEDAHSLLNRVDQALYEAKRSGRNKVVIIP